ncbi:MAG: methyltransferase domain-containing protein [Kofleriaceae bacterium]
MTNTLIDNPYDGPPPRVDFGVAAADYARHRQGHPAETFRRLRALGVGLPGQDVVDLGTGTGDVARTLAGAGARVVGVDPSRPLLDEGARLAATAGVTVAWRQARAEDTGLPDGSADVVTIAQAWHWFDPPRAAVELRRLLRPGGLVAVFYLDWLPIPGSVVALSLATAARHRTEPVVDATAISVHGMYPTIPDDLLGAGLVAPEWFGFDLTQRYSHAGWLGRMRASALVSTMPAPAQRAFADDLTAALAQGFPDPVEVPHRVFGLVARAPSA